MVCAKLKSNHIFSTIVLSFFLIIVLTKLHQKNENNPNDQEALFLPSRNKNIGTVFFIFQHYFILNPYPANTKSD